MNGNYEKVSISSNDDSENGNEYHSNASENNSHHCNDNDFSVSNSNSAGNANEESDNNDINIYNLPRGPHFVPGCIRKSSLFEGPSCTTYNFSTPPNSPMTSSANHEQH